MAIKEILQVFLLFFIVSCTMPYRFYIRNSLNEEVAIMLHLFPNGDKALNESLKYGPYVEKIKFDLVEELNGELLPTAAQNGYAVYRLPPRSIAFVGEGLNSNNFDYDTAVIILEEKRDTLTWQQPEKLQSQSKFLNGATVWHDIK